MALQDSKNMQSIAKESLVQDSLDVVVRRASISTPSPEESLSLLHRTITSDPASFGSDRSTRRRNSLSSAETLGLGIVVSQVSPRNSQQYLPAPSHKAEKVYADSIDTMESGLRVTPVTPTSAASKQYSIRSPIQRGNASLMPSSMSLDTSRNRTGNSFFPMTSVYGNTGANSPSSSAQRSSKTEYTSGNMSFGNRAGNMTPQKAMFTAVQQEPNSPRVGKRRASLDGTSVADKSSVPSYDYDRSMHSKSPYVPTGSPSSNYETGFHNYQQPMSRSNNSQSKRNLNVESNPATPRTPRNIDRGLHGYIPESGPNVIKMEFEMKVKPISPSPRNSSGDLRGYFYPVTSSSTESKRERRDSSPGSKAESPELGPSESQTQLSKSNSSGGLRKRQRDLL